MTQYFKNLGNDTLAKMASISSADIQVPMEIQSRRTKLIQTHNAVSIAANSTSVSSWIQLDNPNTGEAYNTIAISASMSGGTGMDINAEWSFDGTNYFASHIYVTNQFYSGVNSVVSFEVPVCAPYFRVYAKNKDATNAKTTTIYAYLKA